MDKRKPNRENVISSQIIEKYKNEPGMAEIYQHYKNGGEVNALICSPAISDNCSKKLAENEIPHACIQNAEGKGTVIVFFPESNREEAQRVIEQIRNEARHLSEISLPQLKAENIGESIRSIRGVSETYVGVFKEETKAANVKVAITSNRDGTYDIHFSNKDRSKIDPVIMNTIAATRGAAGRLNEERISFENKIKEDLYAGITNPNKEFYVVSPVQPNEYMHFSPAGFEHYRNGRLISDELRSNSTFQLDAHKEIDNSFIRPVTLSTDEFGRVKRLKREEYIETVTLKRTAPVPSVDDVEKAELERMARLLAEYKMSFENNYLNTDFYDKTAPVAEFESEEVATDLHIDREIEMSVSNPKSIPPQVQETIEKVQSLPIEDREYVNDFAREFMDEVRRTNEQMFQIAITEDVISEDLDVMIALYSHRILQEKLEQSMTASREASERNTDEMRRETIE